MFALLIIPAAIGMFLGVPPAKAQNAYITNSGSNSVSVINTATNMVTATINVGTNPQGVAVTRDGSTVYVANSGKPSIPGTVSVINAATNKVTTTITVGSIPIGVAVTPDGSTVYVTNFNDDTVSVIDTATNKVTTTITVGLHPQGVAITPNSGTVYVVNLFGDNGATVSVINAATNKVTATISVGGLGEGLLAEGVAVSPDGSTVYVANFRVTPPTGAVSVISTATNQVIGMIQVGTTQPFGVAVAPAGPEAGDVFVTHIASSGTVSVIDPTTNTVIATINVGGLPQGVAVTPDGSMVYVANTDSNSVSVISTASNTVTTTIGGFSGPVAFGLFIGPAPEFAGTPGQPNCNGKSVSALAKKYGGLDKAAQALGFPSVQALKNAIESFCGQ